MVIDITAVPAAYKKAPAKELQGSIIEVSYPVSNYINAQRQLVTNQSISSKDTGRETVKGATITKKCNVYLPSGYDKNDKAARYNVLYLLHGVGGNRYEWLMGGDRVDERYIICNIVDSLIVNGDIDPLIIVFPDGRSTHDWTDCSFNPQGTNMLGFYYFDYELRYDLIPFIEREYNTYANINNTSSEAIVNDRLHRAIAGLSMGGMQALNMSLGGHRCESIQYTGTQSPWGNGLDTTVKMPGMLDLFAYVGAFANAPTSSDGEVLGAGIASSGLRLDLLYLTCGELDDIAYESGYKKAIDGLGKAAGDSLGVSYQVLIKNGAHDNNVWNNGLYNFLRLIFKDTTINSTSGTKRITLDTY